MCIQFPRRRERFTTAFLSPELREEGIDAWMAATTLWRERFFRWVVKRFGFGADLSFSSSLFVCIGLGMEGESGAKSLLGFLFESSLSSI